MFVQLIVHGNRPRLLFILLVLIVHTYQTHRRNCGLSQCRCVVTFMRRFTWALVELQQPPLESSATAWNKYKSDFSHCLFGPLHWALSKALRLFLSPDILATGRVVFSEEESLCNENSILPTFWVESFIARYMHTHNWHGQHYSFCKAQQMCAVISSMHSARETVF